MGSSVSLARRRRLASDDEALVRGAPRSSRHGQRAVTSLASATGHCFCHACRSFFPRPRTHLETRCTNCDSNFVEFLSRSSWITPSSLHGQHFNFDNELENAIAASLEVGTPDRPTAAKFVAGLAKKPVDKSCLRCEPHCTVCSEDFVVDETATVLPCGHHFHPPCIELWLTKRNTCPVCREAMPEADEEQEVRADDSSRGKNESGAAPEPEPVSADADLPA
mmetsp:Transcript_10719/g.25543  ORF Transcript_10719/g.25543 Transcript_10719/m.25543 type:complete len:222 (-) Transcript_10719:211-876(-)